MPKTRQSYSVEKKLKIVEFAETNGNRAAGREFSFDESMVRKWRKMKNVLNKMNKEKRSLRRGLTHWPELETELKEWVLQERAKERRVSTIDVKVKALKIAEERHISDFKGTNKWCNKFMKRCDLSVRAVSSLGQPLPLEWEALQESFKSFVESKIIGIDLQHIGNMDEVPMSFDMPSRFTIDQKGSENVKITTTGSEKCCFTVVLCVTADGGKLPPFVIFKRKTIPKEQWPKGIVVSANKKGWMTTEEMIKWLEKIWCRRRNSFFKPKSVLILVSAPAHRTEEVKNKIKRYLESAVIPGGLTKLLQPLDISVNKSFKSKIRNQWEKWMVSGYHEYTRGGKMKKASYVEVCNWIINSWNDINPEVIKNGFKKSNVKYYEDSEVVEDIDSNSDSEDIVPPDEIMDLLDDFTTESDEEFDGFKD